MATAKQWDDSRECPICKQVYTDPRILPCGHTFCRSCIGALSKRACPICRERFSLPSIGVDGVTKNFAVANLLRKEELSSSCEASSGAAVQESIASTLTRVIPSTGGAECVTAVTSLGDDVFVLRWTIHQVQVYDASTFTLQRCIAIPPLGCPWGIAACARYKCLYVSDDYPSRVHKVDLSGSNAVQTWYVANYPRGLSVNKANNVVVTSYEANKIQEYTTDGSLVREICLLQADVTSPFHAIQLSTGDYVVSQNTRPGVVSVLGEDGQLVRSYHPSQTSDEGEMDHPRSLAVTKNDDILVADRDNDRILSIDRSLSSAQQLALPVDDGIHVPWAVCLDESRARLYVGEGGGSHRVLVFDSVRL